VEAEVQYNTDSTFFFALTQSLGAALICFRRKYIFVRQQLDTNPNAAAWLVDLVSRVASADWQVPTLSSSTRTIIDTYAVTTDLPPNKANIDIASTTTLAPQAQLLRVVPKEMAPTKPTIIDHSPIEYILRYDWPNHPPRPRLIRELVFGLRDVTVAENAWGGVSLLRNSNLFDGLPQPALKVRSDFFYRTPVRFGTEITPAITVSTPMNLASVTPIPLPLGQHLMALFNDLFPDLSTAKIVRLRALYKFSLRGDSAGAPNRILIANTPISFWPNLSVDQQSVASVVAALATNLVSWRTTHRCAGNGAFGFDVAVLSSSGASGLPILHFEDLRLPLAAVKP
jgi:hypothetical protein